MAKYLKGSVCFFYEMAIVVLTQSVGWSYPCVSCLCDEGSHGGKIVSEPVKWKFHCRQVIPSDNPESAMIQLLCQKDCKLVFHVFLCLDDKSDGVCLTKVVIELVCVSEECRQHISMWNLVL